MGVSDEVVWQEPPRSDRGRKRGKRGEHDHAAIAAALRQRPGEWALIPVTGVLTGITDHIRRGRLAAYRPAGQYEAVRRHVNGETRVYARFVGSGAPSGTG